MGLKKGNSQEKVVLTSSQMDTVKLVMEVKGFSSKSKAIAYVFSKGESFFLKSQPLRGEGVQKEIDL